MHQEYYGNIETEIDNIFKKKEDNGYDMSRRFQLEIVRSKSEVGRNSLRYRGTLVIWNSLSNDLKELKNAKTFKLSLKKARNIINKTNLQKEAAVIINKKEFKVFYILLGCTLLCSNDVFSYLLIYHTLES